MDSVVEKTQKQSVLKKVELISIFTNYLDGIHRGQPFNAVLHPNGYIKCVLTSETDGSRVRLHIWDNSMRGGYRDPAVHNHCWDFSSQVLLGTLREHIYELGQGQIDEENWDSFLFSRNKEERGLKEEGKAPLRLKETLVHTSGNTYSRNHETLHLVIAEGDFTSTLVHEGPTLRTTNNVFMQTGTEPLSAVKLVYQPAAAEILINALKKLIAGIEAQTED